MPLCMSITLYEFLAAGPKALTKAVTTPRVIQLYIYENI